MIVDISIVLNLHAEGKYLSRTVMSLIDAANYARAYGLIVEIVIVLDRPDNITRNVLAKLDFGCFDTVQTVEVDHGSLGLSRNEGISRAHGKYVRLCDGDDLISFNTLAVMFFEAERIGDKAIFVPEWLFAFGERYHRARYHDLDVVSPLSFVGTHPFISNIFFSRNIHDVLQFHDLRLSAGYAYEDWHFNAEAVALGYSFHAAKDTILFYRQRNGSLLNMANSLSVQQIPPSRLFLPEIYLKICAQSYDDLVSDRLRHHNVDRRDYVDSPLCRYLIYTANQIDPAVELDVIRNSPPYFVSQPSQLEIGKRYFEVCRELEGKTFSDVFLLPFFGKGGAERYIANIINELAAQDASILVILGEPHPTNEWLSRLSNRVTSLDIAPWLDTIGAEGVDLVTLKVIQSVAANARVHVRASLFGQRFLTAYGRALSTHKVIFYRFSQLRRSDRDMEFKLPWGFQFICDNIEHIDVVATDNQALIDFDRARIAATPEKWILLPSLYQPELDRSTATEKSRRGSQRILWASRIAFEKRPEVLIAIARKLAEYREDIVVDVHGVCDLNFQVSQLETIPNVVYHGPYDQFEDIAAGDYLCFLYTSAFDGMPNVLLEAAGMGLPIIAPDVGGIGEFIENEQTGVLLPNIPSIPAMADAYVQAILRLERDSALREQMVARAYDRVLERHGRDAFTRNLFLALGQHYG